MILSWNARIRVDKRRIRIEISPKRKEKKLLKARRKLAYFKKQKVEPKWSGLSEGCIGIKIGCKEGEFRFRGPLWPQESYAEEG